MTFSTKNLKIEFHQDLQNILPERWNSLVGDSSPFLEYEFLDALQKTGCTGPQTAWQPHYLILTDSGKLIGAIPFHIKSDSHGEFIFDWEWARAYHQYGVSYYPKLVVAAPFTPATGERILVHPQAPFEEAATAMVRALLEWAQSQKQNFSSLHFLFLPQKEQQFLERFGFLSRLSYQFHWTNRDYQTFDDFLNALHRKRRSQARKEREKVKELGLEIELIEGDQIQEEHLEMVWEFYRSTHQKRWGIPYLNREFFLEMGKVFRHRLVLVLARQGKEWIAGTFNLKKGKHLYGRYWGSLKEYPNLHFECCYYRLIEYAIAHRLELFEAGAQGEHKFFRGFAPHPTYSSHWIAHPQFRQAIGEYVQEEKKEVLRIIGEYNQVSPLTHLRNSASTP